MDKALEAGARALYLIDCEIGGEKQPIPYGHISPESQAVYEIEARAVLDAASAALPATDTSGLVERLRERWEATDAPVAKKINRILRTSEEAAHALEAQAQEIAEQKAEVLRIHNDKMDHFEARIAAEARAEKAEARLAEAEAVIRPLMEQAEHVALGIACRKPDLSNASTALVYAVAEARSYLEGRK